ncbi:tetratricopeptide repeat protein [Lysobacter yangpyeongensis]|uniref:Tetratricopeptide repeat protein n=1 Tax=Lysobacter yangpyeongensis TaxID=346182 RepID=A0ABW0SNX5_9GAMM
MSEPTATGLHAQHQHAPGTVVAGRFRIEAMLGIGGMGVVYRATDLALDVPVALKLLRPELAARPDAFERFRQELLVARQVSSPRVVRIHDLAQHEGQWLISMDYIDGEGLDRRLDRDGALAPEVAAGIARQLAEGLAAAHARGVIHRDLKPANVLIDRDGNAYISDFGVARSLASNGLTRTGAVVGTPDYLSPEQARGDTVDARSDLYALGLILYEMLAGALPFQGGTLSEILAQRMLRSPPPVTQARPQTPAWLARLTDRLLRVQPAHRLQSAQAVMRALDTREVPRDFTLTRRNAIAAAVLVAALAGGGYFVWQSLHPPPRAEVTEAKIAAVAPLHRVLVLPLQAPATAVDAAHGAALTALLRDALQATPGHATVDDERTHQALRQLDPTGAARVDGAALQRSVGADRILRVSLQPSGTRWQAIARLQQNGKQDASFAATAGDPDAAFARLATLPGLAAALGRKSALPFALPCPDACGKQALDAFGQALLAQQRSAPAVALAQVRKATSAAPGFASAWLLQAETALAIGEADIAYEAIEAGQRRADAARAVSLQHRFRAERALLDGDPPTAAAEWQALRAQSPDDTFAELGHARALGAGGDFKGAIAALQALVARDPNDPRAWFELGKFSILAGGAQRAVDDYLVRALVLYKRSGNRYGEAETANALGIGYARLGQTADAEKQYREAVDLRRAVGNRRGLATSLRNLGNIFSQQGKFAEAATVLGQAAELHAALGDRGGLAAVENERGILAEERGDYPAALAHFRAALQTWQKLGEKNGIAQALNDIGFAHYQLGAYDDAQAYLVQSANAYGELGDQTGIIRTRQNLGLLAIARGHWSEARRQLEGSLEAAEQQQMLEEAAVSRRNLAELELHQGHIEQAIAQATKAETLFREREDDRGVADAGLLRVQALLAARADADADKALAGLADAIAYASAEQRGIAALLQSELAARRGDEAAATKAAALAAQLAQASGVRQLQLQVALQRPQSGIELDRDTAALGNVPLRLRYLLTAMRGAAQRHDDKALLAAYREATPILRRGDYLEAWRLHDLARRACVDSAGRASTSCASAADSALGALRAHVPAALRDGFDRALPRHDDLPLADADG